MSSRLISRRRSPVARAARAVDMLEARLVMSTAYYPLLAGDFLENWEDTTRIDASPKNNWNGIPSIVGYGRDRTTTTNVDPQTLLDETGVATSINVNTTSGNNTNGGVHELQLATPIGTTGNGSVGLQPVDSLDDVWITIHLDNTGMSTPVHIKYDLIDVDSTALTSGTPVQKLALQYRLGSTGNFTNVPAGFVSPAADFTSGATGLTTAVDATLPADTIGASQIQIRILSANVSGQDQMVAVDNIKVFGAAGSPGIIGFDATTLTVNETAGVATLNLSRPNTSIGAASVTWTSIDGTAANGADFTGGTGTVSFAAGEYTKSILIPINNDALSEGLETFSVTLANPTNGAAVSSTNGTMVVSIVDNDVVQPTGLLLNELLISPTDGGAYEYAEFRARPAQA
ncbi:MAG: Calx-beta domain-containing protein [Tepidisphaeraceae bacterium]